MNVAALTHHRRKVPLTCHFMDVMRNLTKVVKTAAIAALTVMTAGCLAPTASAAPGIDSGPTAQNVAPAPDCGVPVDGPRVVILATGTEHEPRPALTSRAEQELRNAAEAKASNGYGAKGAVAVIASADGRPAEILPLTPRRADCTEEHGLQREKLINDNITRVRDAVAARHAQRAELDLLSGIDNAVRGLTPGTLIIISNGLSTVGGFDMRRVGWQENPGHLVDQLNQRGLLQNLAPRWRVLFTGLGETAGDQPPLTKPTRDTLVGYWTAICRAATGTGTCEVDQTALPPLPPAGDAPVAVVPVDPISSAVGPDGRTTETVSGSVLFAGDSAELSPHASGVLHDISKRIAAKLAARADVTVTIRGFVADPPGSTPESQLATADARARVVGAAISSDVTDLGFSTHLDVAGVGTPPGITAMVNGLFSEAIASQMRMVTITY